MGIRILGTIPAPLIFGSLIDLSCILWQKTCDNESGACLVYDNKQMSRNLLSLGISLKVLSLIFFFFAWFLYKPPLPSIDTQTHKLNKINSDSNSNSSTSDVPQCCPKFKNKNENAITKL
jgi:organic anion transporter 4A